VGLYSSYFSAFKSNTTQQRSDVALCFAHHAIDCLPLESHCIEPRITVSFMRCGAKEPLQSAADIRHLNFLSPYSLFCANFRIPVFALIPDQTYGTGDLLVALARTHERT
jgi:hypothetical protein